MDEDLITQQNILFTENGETNIEIIIIIIIIIERFNVAYK